MAEGIFIRKKELFWVLGGIVLMFANIFIAVFLTGGKEMYDFSKPDWTLFAIMGTIELLTLVLNFYNQRLQNVPNRSIQHLWVKYTFAWDFFIGR